MIPEDIETVSPVAVERFDLRECLAPSNDAGQAAGIKRKHDVPCSYSGAGCTTFLKTIANQSASFAGVSGDIQYAGITHDEILRYYDEQVVYNEEGEDGEDFLQGVNTSLPPPLIDDHYIATLIVAQAPDFALNTKAPGPKCRLPGVKHKEFISEIRGHLLQTLNISHTRQTLVGDEFVRGISDVEARKRLTTLVVFDSKPESLFLDEPASGLDGQSAWNIVRFLRELADQSIRGKLFFARFTSPRLSFCRWNEAVRRRASGLRYGPRVWD
ncbi:hypothetical protein BDM02DRAFT_3191944 [Thelephora ganbajun]|uniref:Uncharacterized protein n=1 Tax=Thelephora ganbajun TaxID=370292 RepID=A0ACB6Z0L2_THEGA|nr:hypothetical protein BDM02DRAFT_3191944 [Thelephora ganbajun]